MSQAQRSPSMSSLTLNLSSLLKSSPPMKSPFVQTPVILHPSSPDHLLLSRLKSLNKAESPSKYPKTTKKVNISIEVPMGRREEGGGRREEGGGGKKEEGGGGREVGGGKREGGGMRDEGRRKEEGGVRREGGGGGGGGGKREGSLEGIFGRRGSSFGRRREEECGRKDDEGGKMEEEEGRGHRKSTSMAEKKKFIDLKVGGVGGVKKGWGKGGKGEGESANLSRKEDDDRKRELKKMSEKIGKSMISRTLLEEVIFSPLPPFFSPSCFSFSFSLFASLLSLPIPSFLSPSLPSSLPNLLRALPPTLPILLPFPPSSTPPSSLILISNRTF